MIAMNASRKVLTLFGMTSIELFKVSYVYRRSYGMLVEERIFDSRSRKPDNGGIDPLRRILHGVNADDGLPESTVIDLASPDFPPQMEVGFRNPFLQQ